MSIGLLLQADSRPGIVRKLGGAMTPGQLLEEIEKWILEYCLDLHATTFIGQNSESQPTLFCKLHPAAEDIELTFIDSSHLTASANTSTVGPGYHIFICDMLHKLADRFNLEWNGPTDDYCDETGYFHSGDRQSVFAEMKAWLKGVANLFFDGTLKNDDGPVRLAMSVDTGFTWAARAITPMGPRDVEWLKRTAEDPSGATDFFAWWNPNLDAEYFLRRALVRMWSDVRWRTPINDNETEVLRYIADSLETAYKLDPRLAFPWAEWAEILSYLERSGEEYIFVNQKAAGNQPVIGYRRGRDVAVQLPGNWRITVPGSFSNFIPDEKHNYSAFDPPREVWVTSYTFQGDLPKLFQSERDRLLKEPGTLIRDEKDFVASAEIKKNARHGEEFFLLQSSNIGLGDRAVCTIVFTAPQDRDWAIQVWKSLKPP